MGKDQGTQAGQGREALFVSLGEKRCMECGQEILKGGLFLPEKGEGVLCVECAELDELEFLPSGNAALTRRAAKHSSVTYVVLRFSRARKRFERQGIVVESQAVDLAEQECAADEDVRRERQARNQERLAQLDQVFVRQFAEAIRARFPGCPRGREVKIAEHACRRHSGRVGRSAAAKAFDPAAVDLAVIAHIRHHHTNYDSLLMRTGDRALARERVQGKLEKVLDKWKAPADDR